eukprot:3702611-Amphidinium_carterae.1
METYSWLWAKVASFLTTSKAPAWSHGLKAVPACISLLRARSSSLCCSVAARLHNLVRAIVRPTHAFGRRPHLCHRMTCMQDWETAKREVCDFANVKFATLPAKKRKPWPLPQAFLGRDGTRKWGKMRMASKMGSDHVPQ